MMRGNNPKVVESLEGFKTIPSAVSIGADGAILVGADAKATNQAKTGFKRYMGTGMVIAVGDRGFRPEELSAEVLKALKQMGRQRYSEDVSHAVISVPASFSQPQCQATRRAAELAGIEAVALQQEPIAAATAFLNDKARSDANYIIYDLGGGTFDAAIVQEKHGEMHVLRNGGDNHLGGSDFDGAVANWVCEQFGLGAIDLSGTSQHQLRSVVELAKIKLSTVNSTIIDLADIVEISAPSIDLNRPQLELLVEDMVSRTIRITKEQIDELGFGPADMDSIVLVGGPTLMPYIRLRLQEAFDVELDFDQDPMTVVAEGSTIFASTLRQRGSQMATPGARVVELQYESRVNGDVVPIGGVVAGDLFEGEIRFERSTQDWATGWLPLIGGKFITELRLSSSTASEFTVTLRDTLGTHVPCSPEDITVRRGIAIAAPVTPFKYGVARRDGRADWIVEDQVELPARGQKNCTVSNLIRAGTDDEAFVHFIEGNLDNAMDNVPVGRLRISGQDMQRSLRAGDNVGVRIEMDRDRLLTAWVLLEKEDREVVVELDSCTSTLPKAELEDLVAETRKEILTVSEVISNDDDRLVNEIVAELERLEADMNAQEAGDHSASERVMRNAFDLRRRMRKVYDPNEPAAKANWVKTMIERAKAYADEDGEALDMEVLGDLEKKVAHANRLGDYKLIEEYRPEVVRLYLSYRRRQPDFWQWHVRHLRNRQKLASDRSRFHELLRRAEQCTADDDLEGAEINVDEAHGLLPWTMRADRFSDSLL
ncbi:MAG: Hsp70 family protein [Armatimonadota bacterium]|nr:Hsp70 family protein [Armatimonadota bacterium]